MSAWSVNRWIVFALLVGFVGLLLEARYSHMHLIMVRRDLMAWIPICSSGLMIGVCLLALMFWGMRMRRLLFWASLVSIAVGYQGFSFHSNGAPLKSIRTIAVAPYSVIPQQRLTPPEMAPLSFSILGIFGALACAERLQSQQSRS